MQPFFRRSLLASSIVALALSTSAAQNFQGRVISWGRQSQANVPADLTNTVVIGAAGASGGVGAGNLNLAIRSDGTVTGWVGQPPPAGISNVVGVAAGGSHGLLLRQNGTVFGWGDNSFGQISVPANLTNAAAVTAGYAFSVAARSNGTVVQWPASLAYIGSAPPGLSNVIAISAGAYHCLALHSTGTVTVWGNIGAVPTEATNVVAVASGEGHSLVLRNDGTVVGWGQNSSGQVSVPIGLTNVIAIAAGGNHSIALRQNRSVVVWGDTSYGLSSLPAGLTNVIAIAAGTDRNLAIQAGPILLSGPSNVVASFGDNVAFTVQVAANSTPTLQWQHQGSDLPGETNASIMITNGQHEDIGQYSVLVTADGWTIVASAQLVFGPAPVVTTSPQDVFVMPGETASFTVVATNAIPFRYEWFFEGVQLSDQTNASLTLSNCTSLNSGVYLVRLISEGGRVTEVSARLSVLSGAAMGIPFVWGSPTNLPAGLSGLVAVSGGNGFTLGLRADGTVISWGENIYWQTNVTAGLSDVVEIAAGSRHGLARRRDGSVVGWGDNFNGQANPPAIQNAVSIAGGNSHSLAALSDGTVLAWGNGYLGATSVPAGLTGVVAVAAGDAVSLALKGDGTLIGWGQNSSPDLTNVASVAAGHVHGVALLSNSTVAGFGFNLFGQASPPPGLSNVTAVAANYARSLALRVDRTVVGWGQVQVPTNLSNIISIACGDNHNVAVRETGVFIVAQPTNRISFFRSNVSFSVTAIGVAPLSFQWLSNNAPITGATNQTLLLTNLSLLAAGDYSVQISTSRGTQLSAPASLVVEGPPLITTNPVPQSIPLGSNATFGVTALGTAPLSYRWFFEGQAITNEINSTLTIQSASLFREGNYGVVVSNQYGTATSTLARLSFVFTNGTMRPNVFAWGANNSGQRTEPPNATNLIMIACGSSHNLAVTRDGAVLGWGANDSGQASPPNFTNAVRASGGGQFSVVVTEDGRVVAWGSNVRGQTNVPFGLSNVVDVAAGFEFAMALRRDGTVVAWGRNQAGQTNVPPGLKQVVAIAAGQTHSLALRSDGTIVGWGRDLSGQIQIPSTATNAVGIAGGTAHSLAVLRDGTVIGWGNNFSGQTQPPLGLSNVTRIATGDRHALAVQANGRVVGWGTNDLGQITIHESLTNVVGVAAGATHSLALTGSGEPRIVFHPMNLTSISGRPTLFTVQAVGELPLTYRWSKDGNEIPGATNSRIVLPPIQLADAGTFTVTISNRLGVASSQATLTVLPFTGTASSTTNGLLRLRWTNLLGTNFVIESSTNLSGWTPLTTNIVSSNVIEVLLLPAPANPVQFYRGRSW